MLDIILLLGDPLVVAKLIYSPSHLSLSFAVVPQKLEFVDCNLPRDFRNTSPRLFLLFRSFVLNFFLFRSPPPFPSGPMATQRKKRTDCNNYRKGCIHRLHEKKVTVDSRKHFRVAMTPSSAEQIIYTRDANGRPQLL